jgi:hypothetical protein
VKVRSKKAKGKSKRRRAASLLPSAFLLLPVTSRGAAFTFAFCLFTSALSLLPFTSHQLFLRVLDKPLNKGLESLSPPGNTVPNLLT